MRKRGSLFSKAFVISMCLILMNVGFIVLKNFQNGTITGNSVSEISDLQVSRNSKIFFAFQVILLTLIMVFVFFYDKKKDKEELDDIGLEIIKPHSNETDLDILYKVLQKRKKISLSKIAKSFKVEKDVAMEWCKILESGELATIDYPGFGEPKLLILEKKEAIKLFNPKEIKLVPVSSEKKEIKKEVNIVEKKQRRVKKKKIQKKSSPKKKIKRKAR
jgi:uncharacterized membrane protein (DUF485 family)